MVLKNKLKLDLIYELVIIYFNEFKEEVKKLNNFELLIVVVECMDGFNESYIVNIFKDFSKLEKNIFFVDCLVKILFWLYGGYKVIIVGNKDVYEFIKKIYLEGERLFDFKFMSCIYGKLFEVVYVDEVFKLVKGDSLIGKYLKGNRIGFDVGGFDMKVFVVVDGVLVFSIEVVWFLKLNSDLNYYKENICKVI